MMNITDDIKSVTYLKAKAADLLNQINETHRPIIITQNGEPRAVLQDPKSYENMRNAFGLLKLISLGEMDVRNGRKNYRKMYLRDFSVSRNSCFPMASYLQDSGTKNICTVCHRLTSKC